MAVNLVTAEDIEQALTRVEHGESGIDDANLLRNYIRSLESLLELESDEVD